MKKILLLLALLFLPLFVWGLSIQWERPSVGIIHIPFINDKVGVGTTTPAGSFHVASSSATSGAKPQLWVTDTVAGANNKHWTIRSSGGFLYVATSSDALATSTTPGLTINTNGFLGVGTSTPAASLSTAGQFFSAGSATSTFMGGVTIGTTGSAPGLSVLSNATSTLANGLSILAGCFAVNNVCLGAGSGTLTSVATTWPIQGGPITTAGTLTFGGLSTSSAAVVGNLPYFSGVNTFANVATTAVTCGSGASCTAFTAIGASPVSITATGLVFSFTPTTNYGVTTNSTTTPIWLKGSPSALFASSTSYFDNIYVASSTGKATSTIQNLAGVLDASTFAGSDIGAKVNAAYAALPATGGTIKIPRGVFSFSTPIIFGVDGKTAMLLCDPGRGTKLTYTGTATSTKFNTGISDFSPEYGMKYCDLRGPETSGSDDGTIGVGLGGSLGAPGVVLEGNHIVGFGKGVAAGANTWYERLVNNHIEFNYRNIHVYSANNSGENIIFDGNNISDCYLVTKCVYFEGNGSVTSTFTGNVFDDAQLYFEDGNSNIAILGGGFENPNEVAIGRYNYIVTSGGGFSNITIVGTQFSNGSSVLARSPNQFILNGANLVLSNVTVQSFDSVSSPAFVNNSGGDAHLTVNGYKEIGTSVDNMATSSVAFAVDATAGDIGYVGIGTSAPDAELEIEKTGTNAVLHIGRTDGANLRLKAQDDKNRITYDTSILFDSDEIGTTKMAMTTTGVGVGTTTPRRTLAIQGVDNGTVSEVHIPATSANVTTADTFMEFTTTQGSVGSIAGTAVSGTIIYNTFTGSHWSKIDDMSKVTVGDLLETTGETIEGYKEHLTKSRLACTRASKTVYGVYGGTDKEGHDTVLSIGAGKMKVANKGSDIEAGDLLMSSDVCGMAEKQKHRFLGFLWWVEDSKIGNITAGKAMEDVHWVEGEQGKEIAVIYLGG